jgi:hypothetical protein
MTNDNNDLVLLRRLQELVAELKAAAPALDLLKCTAQRLIDTGTSERAIFHWSARHRFDAKLQAQRARELEIQRIKEHLKIDLGE